jgi:hypothetical protein
MKAMARKHVRPDEEIALHLSDSDRRLILEDVACLDPDYTALISETPAGEPLMLTLDCLDEFGGYIAAEANHCPDRRMQKRLDAIFREVQNLLDTHTDEDEDQPHILKFKTNGGC